MPRTWWANDGVTETKDVFKLIVSTSEFDARSLCQQTLDPYRPEQDLSQRGLGSETMRGSLHGLLNSLMDRIQWRTVSDRPENASIEDWATSQLLVTTIRPLVRPG